MLGRILTRIKNKRGSIAVPLILSVIGLPIVLFSGYFALQFKSQQVETDEFIIFKESIHSVLKFTLFGIERKWCFRDRWSFNTKCDSLNDDKSTERILFGETELASLRKFKQDNPDAVCGTCTEENCKKCLNLPSDLSKIKLEKFSETFTSAELKNKAQFALSRYFATYASDSSSQIKINSLTLTVSRPTEGHQVRGNEKYVKIEAVASFTERGEAKTYKVDWTLSLFPRELNMFSLILAKDMYFYKTTAASRAPADQNADKCIPSESESTSFASIPQAQKSSHKGFVFQSPVFVNGNLHFKTPSDSSSDKFTPVYFMDRLYLGKGELLYDSNTPFTPKKAGKLMNHENLNIGSLKGVLLEDSDKGLEVFSGQEACESRDGALAECLEAAADGKINYVVDKSEIEIETSVGKINAGGNHTCAIKSGELWCWGYNLYGQLGDGTITTRLVPTLAPTMTSGVTQVSAGNSHTCAIKSGALYCWGRNTSGQLGDGTTSLSSVPTQVTDMDSGVTEVSAGYFHTCAIKSGALFCWGRNNVGQLGDGNTTNFSVSVPTPVPTMTSGVTQVSAGYIHTCAIKSGELWCWGYNQYGRLGDGTTSLSSVPTLTSVPNPETRTVYAFGTGHSHNCFKIISTEDSDSPDSDLSSIEELYCWGNNRYGQFGDGTRVQKNTITLIEGMSDVKQISAGAEHTCAIQDGKLYCWGLSSYGQLGGGTRTHRTTPTQVINMNSDVKQISAGERHTCAIQDGKLYCWGRNTYGRLGDGTTTHRTTPNPVPTMTSDVTEVSAGGSHTCAIKDGALYCWGNNGSGRLGDGTGTHRSAPTPVLNMDSGVTQVSAGYIHTCAIKSGALYCWGSRGFGKLGGGTTTTKVTNMTSGVTQVSAGYIHTCAIKNGALYCWGFNGSGRLGDGTTTTRSVPTPVLTMTSGVKQVSAGAEHTCAIAEDEALYCWGTNQDAQLAQEPSKLALSKVPILIGGAICLVEEDEDYLKHLDWFYDLSPFTRTSWDFTETTPHPRSFSMDATVASPSGANLEFHLKALIGDCVVESSATFVTGFFVCDKFTIKQRTTPLRIIGTVITSQLEVHPSALKHGVVWSSIWYPQALYELRKHLILSKDVENPYKEVKNEETGVITREITEKRSCDNDKNYLADPIHPDSREESVNCNPGILRKAADPFTWTTVDPDCAQVDNTDPEASCKFYDRKYLSRPISETGIVE